MILLSLDINFLILWDAPSRRSTDIHRGIPSVARNGGTDDGSTKSRSTRIDRRAWLQDRRRDADAATNLVGPAHRGVAGRRAGAPPAFAIQKRWPHRAWSGPRQSRSLRSEEHTSELQSLMRISYAAFCLKNKNKN